MLGHPNPPEGIPKLWGQPDPLGRPPTSLRGPLALWGDPNPPVGTPNPLGDPVTLWGHRPVPTPAPTTCPRTSSSYEGSGGSVGKGGHQRGGQHPATPVAGQGTPRDRRGAEFWGAKAGQLTQGSFPQLLRRLGLRVLVLHKIIVCRDGDTPQCPPCAPLSAPRTPHPFPSPPGGVARPLQAGGIWDSGFQHLPLPRSRPRAPAAPAPTAAPGGEEQP